MECIEAQAVISEALDRNPVDASVLEAAKAHCRECEQCAAYVRALNAVRRATLPEPPADLADRIVAAVRAEAAADAAAAAAAAGETPEAAEALEAEQPAEEPEPEPADDRTTTERALDAAAAAIAAGGSAAAASAAAESAAAPGAPAASAPAPAPRSRFSIGNAPRDRRFFTLVGVAAAAILVVVIGSAIGILNAVRGGTSTASSTSELVQQTQVTQAPAAAPQSNSAASGGAPDLSGGAASKAAPTTSASQTLYVVFNQNVYRLTGPAGKTVDQVNVAGSMQVSFEATALPQTRNVYTDSSKGLIYIPDDAKELQAFQQVTREYKGLTYGLRSGPIPAFGGWPTLPPDVPAPTSPDGSPTFQPDTTDAAGLTIYHRIGANARFGIAVPPGTPTTDPAAGNPNWTWWLPTP